MVIFANSIHISKPQLTRKIYQTNIKRYYYLFCMIEAYQSKSPGTRSKIAIHMVYVPKNSLLNLAC